EPIVKDVPTIPPPTGAPPQPTVRQSDFDADGDGFYVFEEFEQAVAALYPSYQWPANYQVDPTTLLSGYASAGAQGALFEVGGEYTIIGSRHQCAWEMAWLDGFREGDEALMEQSLGQLQTVTLDDPMMTDPDSRNYLKTMFQRASLGDPALIQQDVTYNCRRTDFISSVPATPPIAPSPGAATPGR
ncbi:MAG: hypothetical protein M3Q71_24700, partial [Chloroflexota bacterium]|nr:hypothetical protein [Chloroflexota bacterium]